MEDYEFIVMLDFDFSNIDACPFRELVAVDKCPAEIKHRLWNGRRKGMAKKVNERQYVTHAALLHLEWILTYGIHVKQCSIYCYTPWSVQWRGTQAQSTSNKEGPATRFPLDPAVLVDKVTAPDWSLLIGSWRSPASPVRRELPEAHHRNKTRLNWAPRRALK